MLHDTVEVANKLLDIGVSARVVSMHTIKPIDKTVLMAAACETKAVFTIEEHSLTGGLGSAVAEVLMEAERRPQIFKRIGLKDEFSDVVGTQRYLKKRYGLDVTGILMTIRESLKI